MARKLNARSYARMQSLGHSMPRATLKQRMYYESLCKKLSWSTVGIRDMTKFEISRKIEKAKKLLSDGGAACGDS